MLGAAEKNKEKVKAICTGFSVLVSQSVEFSFSGKTKNSNVDNLSRSLTLSIHDLLDFTALLYEKIQTTSCNGASTIIQISVLNQ